MAGRAAGILVAFGNSVERFTEPDETFAESQSSFDGARSIV